MKAKAKRGEYRNRRELISITFDYVGGFYSSGKNGRMT